jgi:hypothetical protein
MLPPFIPFVPFIRFIPFISGRNLLARVKMLRMTIQLFINYLHKDSMQKQAGAMRLIGLGASL